MLVVQISVLCVLMFIIPTIVGGLFYKVDKTAYKLPFLWISGQIVLWAGFLCICVSVILLQKGFHVLQWLFSIYTGVLAFFGLVLLLLEWRRKKQGWKLVDVREQRKNPYGWLWLVFVALLLLQLILTGVMAYEEGDDAFYIAISTITVNADEMYSKLPYTGGATGLDARHGLAPFPIWISYLAAASGIPAVTIAHIAVPVMLIIMAYAIYLLIGCRLLEGRKGYLPFFMVLVELMILFGGYSAYSAENFLLVRTSQGKAVLANIVIPFLVFLFIRLLEKLQKKEKAGGIWILLALTMMVACLCSTLGALLVCILLGVVGLCIVVCYRNWKALFAMAACCVVPVCVAALYFVLG